MKFKLFIIMSAVLIAVSGCRSEKKYKIAYNVLYDMEKDNYEVFVMDMDGRNKKNISNREGVDWVYYAWKDKLYFISDRDTTHRSYFLYEMDAEGKNVRKISDLKLRDSWLGSRYDGTQIIVNPHPSIDSVFYIQDLDGKKLKTVETGLAFASDPIFSPDGSRIIFRGSIKKSKREKGFVDELYSINEDGSDLRRLTHYPPNDTTAKWYAYKAGPPKWNNRDNFISYQSQQKGKYSLFAVTPDGEKQWKLTGNPVNEGWHEWSSDGNWLAVEIFDLSESQFHIALMDWRAKEMTVLTDSSYKYQQAPVFVEVLE